MPTNTPGANPPFTDEQIQTILNMLGQGNAVMQYTGARYVPIFANPIQWNSANTYEPLTIVTDHGNSYTSRQYVPRDIELTNTDFWVETGNYNAQIEQYRQEVLALSGEINDTVKPSIDKVNNKVNYITRIDPSDYTDLNEAIKSATTSNDVIYLGKITTDKQIVIPASATVIIDSIYYTGTDYAVKITNGIGGNIKLGNVDAPNGSGITFDFVASSSLNNSSDFSIEFDSITAKNKCINFNPTNTPADSQGTYNLFIRGSLVTSSEDTAFYIKPTQKTAFGNVLCNITNIRSNNENYALIADDAEGGQITGIRFIETSLEGSTNGIYLNFTNSFEYFYGSFRVRELQKTGNKIISLNGDLYQIGVCDISFDYIMPKYVENNITTAGYIPKIFLRNFVTNEINHIPIKTIVVLGNKLQYMDFARNITSITSEYEWNDTLMPYQFFTNKTSGNVFNIPSWFDTGNLIEISCATDHPVVIKNNGTPIIDTTTFINNLKTTGITNVIVQIRRESNLFSISIVPGSQG